MSLRYFIFQKKLRAIFLSYTCIYLLYRYFSAILFAQLMQMFFRRHRLENALLALTAVSDGWKEKRLSLLGNVTRQCRVSFTILDEYRFRYSYQPCTVSLYQHDIRNNWYRCVLDKCHRKKRNKKKHFSSISEGNLFIYFFYSDKSRWCCNGFQDVILGIDA